MFKNRILYLIFLFILFAVPIKAYGYDDRPRLTIRQFDDRTQTHDAPAQAIMDMMVTELGKADLFNIVERERLDYIASELKLSQSGLMDAETAPQIGKIKGAQYVMTGAITLYYYNEDKSGFSSIVGRRVESKTAYVTLDIRIIDTTTSEVVYSAAQEGTAKRSDKRSGFFGNKHSGTYGGILAAATRDAVIRHVKAIEDEMTSD